MTTDEIYARLKIAFPEEYVSFSVSVNSYEKGTKNIEIQIYVPDCGHVDCDNVEDGIRRIKIKRGELQPNIELAI